MRAFARLQFAILTALLIGVGLLTRASFLNLPPMVAKYSGSIVWGAMVYSLVACIAPKKHPLQTAAIAALIAVGVEASQLCHLGVLDAFRRTTFGVLLIGRFFSWWDIVSYLAGIVAIGLLDAVLLRPAATSTSR